MANLVHSARRDAVRIAPADPMAPDVRRFGERPTAVSMVRRHLFPGIRFPEARLEVTEPGWRIKVLRRAS